MIKRKQRRKKAISELMAYVLLIGITITMSIAIYSWLRFYVFPHQIEECPEDVFLDIENYTCNNNNKIFYVTIKNKGFFNVFGYIAKIRNETIGLPVWLLAEHFFPQPLLPGKSSFDSFSYATHKVICEIEIEPFRIDEKNRIILCAKSIVRRKIEGCGTCI